MINKTIQIRSITGNDNPYEIDFSYDTDNLCPRCHTGVESLEVDGFFVKTSKSYLVYLLEYCPVCNRMALREFSPLPTTLSFGSLDARKFPSSQYPIANKKKPFSDNIQALSPRFVEIYHQAEKAEDNGCNEVCGMGYRKSLEFLIKDFLISLNPDEASNIASQNLGNVINKIDNEKIRILAQRSAWLGNDECHYVRKHENYSVAELKTFIDAIVSYLEMELTFDQALKISSAHS